MGSYWIRWTQPDVGFQPDIRSLEGLIGEEREAAYKHNLRQAIDAISAPRPSYTLPDGLEKLCLLYGDIVESYVPASPVIKLRVRDGMDEMFQIQGMYEIFQMQMLLSESAKDTVPGVCAMQEHTFRLFQVPSADRTVAETSKQEMLLSDSSYK